MYPEGLLVVSIVWFEDYEENELAEHDVNEMLKRLV